MVVIWGPEFVAMKFALRDRPVPAGRGALRVCGAAARYCWCVRRLHWKWPLVTYGVFQGVGRVQRSFSALQGGHDGGAGVGADLVQVFFAAIFGCLLRRRAAGRAADRPTAGGARTGCFAMNFVAPAGTGGHRLLGSCCSTCAAAGRRSTSWRARRSEWQWCDAAGFHWCGQPGTGAAFRAAHAAV